MACAWLCMCQLKPMTALGLFARWVRNCLQVCLCSNLEHAGWRITCIGLLEKVLFANIVISWRVELKVVFADRTSAT